MTDFKTFLQQLHKNLQTLQERQAKYGGQEPLDLRNQIDDHKTAIQLTEQALAGELSETDWAAALQPLLISVAPFRAAQQIVVILGQYASDQGAALSQTAGPTAQAAASDLSTAVLDRLRQTPKGGIIAGEFVQEPAVYQKPLEKELAQALVADGAFAAQLKTLLKRYLEARQSKAGGGSQAGGGPRASLSGQGVITQSSHHLSAGDRGIVGSAAGGKIIVGDQSRNIDTGGGSYVEGAGNVVGDISGSGVAVGAQAQVTVQQGLSGLEAAQLFAPIYRRIEAKTDLPPQDRADLKTEVEEIEAEVVDKTDPAEMDDDFLGRRLRHINRMAPDIVEVIATTLANPAAGLGLVAAKIAARAREVQAAS